MYYRGGWMTEVKVFKIIGEIVKPNFHTKFSKEIRALKSEDAVEKIYKDIGSKHRAKRFQIKIKEIKEIKLENIKDPVIRKLSLGEEESVN